MPVTESPLRYPGGKTKTYDKVKKILDGVLTCQGRVYIEPYAGGAGLALKLLYNHDVERIVLNDLDYHIYCFWKACIEETDLFCDMVHNTAINIEEWNKQRNIYVDTKKHTVLQIGFSTFFLNRCNVSGIIKGGPIGGSEQNGKYKIDARFNTLKKSYLVNHSTVTGKIFDFVFIHLDSNIGLTTMYCIRLANRIKRKLVSNLLNRKQL